MIIFQGRNCQEVEKQMAQSVDEDMFSYAN